VSFSPLLSRACYLFSATASREEDRMRGKMNKVACRGDRGAVRADRRHETRGLPRACSALSRGIWRLGPARLLRRAGHARTLSRDHRYCAGCARPPFPSQAAVALLNCPAVVHLMMDTNFTGAVYCTQYMLLPAPLSLSLSLSLSLCSVRFDFSSCRMT
jgi:hypothetical protein